MAATSSVIFHQLKRSPICRSLNSTRFLLKSTPETTVLNSTLYSRSSTDSNTPHKHHWTWTEHKLPPRYPLPPFTQETALQKVKAAETAWNSKDPFKVSLAYTPDSVWRNRDEIFRGRVAIEQFLTRKWKTECEYKLEKNLWTFHGNRIAVRFEYEWKHQSSGNWFRTHGNELWEFDDKGYMKWRDMSANDIHIDEQERRLI
mmetsp:Transcript_1306/g.2402  ORF Transcript_1306/g.2402 Transcript_1306/m.2402 type:complete len:202 (-) Transcript_1306:925-1530(-)|eukprot:CAMPEP_0182443066 /NCGR_PEP_ID=MMETSP1172-20130603/1898_1 /TAXON_ID=708627 /ORGANISM="Timspurckia oligopyrenoides, Strain CCMP3278" /LENGTH=201 /DNA_ID=CAMNT_0024638231 /DNA_START=84 /DNA_END=689 /DNA_ORIENTATION=+